MTTQRTNAWIEREYGFEKWIKIHEQITQLLSEGETDLPQAISNLLMFNYHGSALKKSKVVICGQEIECLSLYARTAFYNSIAAIICKHCNRNTGAVIELGSGWGLNLFNVWLHGGPQNAQYLGLEYTKAGRDCCKLLSSHAQNMDISTYAFDLNEPDFQMVPNGLDHVVVFSVHGIEQVPIIKPGLFHEIVKLAPRVTGIHFEPVGWQMPPEVRNPALSGSTHTYAEKNDYNRNMWEVLLSLQSEGVLAINEIVPEAQSINPANAVSIIIWETKNKSKN